MPLNPDRLAELEEERGFLLRSLADLEREHEAGDVDEVDYRELRDGYTVRAAATLRAIEDGRAVLAERPPVNWRRRAIGIGVTLGVIGIVWWALVATSAERAPGQQITGLDPRDERQLLLVQARAAQSVQPGVAADLYAQVLADDPDNAEALTYRGWSLALAARGLTDADAVGAQLREALTLLDRATEIDPAYPDPHCFLAIVLFNTLGLAEDARPHVDTCLEFGPPADVRGLVEGLRDEIDREIAG